MSRIWAFLGVRPGDNAQVMALARELGQPFDEKILSYNILHLLTGRFMGASPDFPGEELSGRSGRPSVADLIISGRLRSGPDRGAGYMSTTGCARCEGNSRE